MEKLNIAEILKDCPKGMELDCVMYDNVTFEGIKDVGYINILIKTPNGVMELTKSGCYHVHPNAKCVIFPKGKTTWEGFQRPFKDGDVVFFDDSIAIFKEWGDETLFRTYVKQYIRRESIDIGFPLFGKYIRKETRLATEEEKQKLFDAIKDNGYRWNPETKTLEKLIKPKFKVGDKVRYKGESTVITITGIKDNYYFIQFYNPRKNDYQTERFSFKDQDDWELVPNKFDISTLMPFDKVLARDNDKMYWFADIYSHYLGKDKNYQFRCVGTIAKQCIPYKGNEHLLGTTNDCDEYYKTWE